MTRLLAIVALGSTLFALAFSYPLLRHLGTAGLAWDWGYNTEKAWAAWYDVARLHQFPWSQQWVCGGYPIWAHPDSHLGPFFLLHLLFGPVVGLHLEVVAHIAIGFAGAYVLARVVNISSVGAVACGIAFMGSSWYYLHLGTGHVMFMAYAYAPWVLALFWLSIETSSFARMLLSAVPLALIMFEGGTVDVLPHVMFLFGALAVALAVTKLSFRPLIAGVGICVLAAALTAIKWIPMLLLLGNFHRPWPDGEVNPLAVMASESRYRRSLLALCAASAAITIPCALRYHDLFQRPAWSALW